ncbi:hypothetical protein LZ32DRAFT_188699 [Colletotrichum eremochloae]|nr:hypothetical protein LZ32DRAFT_188699 [Colletotrichum eremochloae]
MNIFGYLWSLLPGVMPSGFWTRSPFQDSKKFQRRCRVGCHLHGCLPFTWPVNCSSSSLKKKMEKIAAASAEQRIYACFFFFLSLRGLLRR